MYTFRQEDGAKVEYSSVDGVTFKFKFHADVQYSLQVAVKTADKQVYNLSPIQFSE